MSLIAFQSAALAVAVAAAVTDARSGRIPNWLTLPAAAGALALHGIVGGRWGVLQSAAGLLLCAGVPWVVFRTSRGRAIGGGDVKLFGALGAWLGPSTGLEIELSALGLLLVVALLRLAYAGQLLRVVGATGRLLASPFSKAASPVAPVALTEMRLGPAIALATVVSVASQHVARWVPWL